MSVVKINAIEVPEGAGPQLEERFAARAGAVENSPGFEGFQLLRPVEGEDRYFVMAYGECGKPGEAAGDVLGPHRDVDADEAEEGHAHGGGGDPAQRPVATGSSILSFEVVERVDPPSA